MKTTHSDQELVDIFVEKWRTSRNEIERYNLVNDMNFPDHIVLMAIPRIVEFEKGKSTMGLDQLVKDILSTDPNMKEEKENNNQEKDKKNFYLDKKWN